MKFDLPQLPYPGDALVPHLSAETLALHHGRHHRAYLQKLEKAIADTPDAARSLDELVMRLDGAAFNNAAQAWNHDFLWHSMSPRGGGEPGGDLARAISRDLGGIDAFKQTFRHHATTHFGSGWTWLAASADGRLHVFSTADADTPIRNLQAPLLTLDMWEHAYYVDYRNDKHAYVQAFLDELVNWEFARENYARWSSRLREAA